MKARYTLLFLALLIHHVTKAQSEESMVFGYAFDLYEQQKFEDAAISLQKFLRDFPKSELKGRAHYNLAICYKDLKDNQKAKAVFQEILDQDYNERDENSLMEPYTLYKHHSCRALASMALEEKNYKEAEKYIHLFDKKYPYQHFCGNEWSAYDMYKAVMLAKVYEATNRTDQAMKELIPYIFSNALASNEGVLEELSTILDKHFTKADIRAEMNKAIESLTIEKKKKETIATIQLFNVNVAVEYYEDTKGDGKEFYKEIVRKSEFFKKYL